MYYDIWDDPANDPARGEEYAPPPAPFSPPPRGPAITWGNLNPPQNVPGGWSDQHTGGFTPANNTFSSGSQDLSYWASRGVPADQIFDFSTGQTRPGWTRTGNGYERAATTTPPPGGGYVDPPGGGGGVFGGGGLGSVRSLVEGAPGFQAPRYNAPGPFSWNKPAPFQAPDKNAIFADPGFQARLELGQKAIENAASAKGQSRTGATWKGLIDYAEGMGSQEYGQVYGRRASEYDRSYRNAFEDAVTTYGFLADERQREFTNELAARSAEYAPSLETWRAQNERDMFGENLGLSKMGLVADILKAIYQGGKPG